MPHNQKPVPAALFIAVIFAQPAFAWVTHKIEPFLSISAVTQQRGLDTDNTGDEMTASYGNTSH
jgi:hypothetical protein